ncbi:LOW QUALITY PROTEIN: hypothetical protein U9M48_038969 [Paspalum notatum var. saurae]|uniref:Integrase catalytic domain-containing protein n=1 Tax=Paspalum notatum var. saurae TaxID=547442 RepID=A0AAQ3UIK7_PASNO
MASSSTPVHNPLIGHTISEKLTKGTYALWKAQVLAVIRGARLEGYLTGATKAPAATIKGKDDAGKEVNLPNPAFEDWVATDQQVLGFLLPSMSKEVLIQLSVCKTAREVWTVVEAMFTSMTKARSINTRIALPPPRRESSPWPNTKMRSLGDEMASSGKPLEDDELISYILTGLDHDYNPIVSALVARTDPLTVREVYSQLLSFEQRLELQQADDSYSMANAASCGREGQRGRGRSRGGHGPRGRGRGSNNMPPRPNNFNTQSRGGHQGNNRERPECQLCKKRGHRVIDCWNSNYILWSRLQLVHRYGCHRPCHGELDKLTIRDRYKGHDQIHTASGAGMNISHIGHSVVKTPSRDLHLNNILYVPQANKNLVSVHKLKTDNSVFLEFHPNFFLVKDQATKTTLLKGRCHKGLYPLPSSFPKQAYGTVKPSVERWHSRLGHPSSQIIDKSPINSLICDACQKAKSHQLPYSKSHSISTRPLELIFSDVWGQADSSASGNKYYVSFIDDYSKFSWIYPLKFKSEVFQKFVEFQNLVERQFDRKIVTIQTDWGGEYQKLHSFFSRVGITHHVSCPYAHQQNGSAERKHRHIVEVGLALLAYASMPLKFWDDAFISAVYLINRTPSKVLDYETPLERLYHTKPDYASLRVFGRLLA